MDHVLSGATTILTALGLLAGPLVLAAVVLHATERRITVGLMRLAGRGAVLVTGWLGVPIHELSHAAMCVVFRHRIQKIVLFHPDPRSGTLGYVNHAWNRRSPWQVVGAFFVGIAPLLGGTAAILLLLRLLLPGALAIEAPPLPAGPADAAGWGALGAGVAEGFRGAARAIFSPEALGTWRPWLFLYLALCIGSHVSPSREDLRGSLVGGLAFLAVLVVAGTVMVTAGRGELLVRAAWTAGLGAGLALLLVAAVNVPLALVVGWAGRMGRA